MAARKLIDEIKAAQSDATADDEVVPVLNIQSAPAEEEDSDVAVFDNIPIPTGRAVRQSEYPWDKLDAVGKSFFVHKEGVEQDKLLGRLTTAISNRKKRFPEVGYIVRKYTGPKGKLGVMVWRTK